MNNELETKYMRGVLPPRGKYIKLVPTGRYHEGVEIMEPVDVTVMVEALESAWTKRQESALAELAEIKRRFDALELSTQQRKPLTPVEGDLLPAVGSKVLIHLARQDEWVEHTVVGYYVWGSLDGRDERMHRVFVRVVSDDGILNARMLRDVRPIEAAHGIKATS